MLGVRRGTGLVQEGTGQRLRRDAVVLDCCRSGFNTIVGGGRSVAASFMSRAAENSQIRPDFPNSHIIYSTTSGSVASDGERGKGGPFMSIFTEEIKPDQEVTQATRKRLRESVPDLCQLAPETSLLERDFYFGLGPTRQDRAGESAAAAFVAAAAAAPSSPAAGADEVLQALLREHGVEDALPWLVREGVTRCEHLRDVTEQELHDSGLGKFAVRRFSSLLTALQISAPAEETSEKTEQLRAEKQMRQEAVERSRREAMEERVEKKSESAGHTVVPSVTRPCTLRGHSGDVNSVAYSPDGKHVLSGSDDKTVKIWDAQTGKEVSVLVCHHLSIAACTDADLRVWSMSRSAR